MANTAAHLVDRVVPDVPVRQFVLSLPFELRALAAFKPDVLRAMASLFVDAIFGLYRARARRGGLRGGVRLRGDEPVEVLAVGLPCVLRRRAGAIRLAEEDGLDGICAERRERLAEARGGVRRCIARLRNAAASVAQGSSAFVDLYTAVRRPAAAGIDRGP
jgi:hypothetical protein